MSTGHALLAPSSAHRWLECSASLAMTADMPETTSKYAEEGTKAHELAELCLTTGLGTEHFTQKYDEEMREYVQKYVDYVNSVAEAYRLLGMHVELHTEVSLPLEKLTGEKDARGTSDVVITAVSNLISHIIVIDLKYGFTPVEAENNPQLKMYALAALDEFSLDADFDVARMIIYQPRAGGANEWEIPVARLIDWKDEVLLPLAHAAHNLYKSRDLGPLVDQDFTPGEKQCKYCKALPNCGAATRKVEQEIAIGFDVIEEYKPVTLDDEYVAKAYSAIGFVESWVKSIQQYAYDAALNGKALNGTKLVEGRKGHRKWTDEKVVEAEMKSMKLKVDEMYDKVLISPTTAEKVLKENERKWKKVAVFIQQAEGKPVLVPDTDKRPAMEVKTVSDKFEELD